MKTKNSTWKVVLIAIAIIIAVALMAVLGVQSYMNRAMQYGRTRYQPQNPECKCTGEAKSRPAW